MTCAQSRSVKLNAARRREGGSVAILDNRSFDHSLFIWFSQALSDIILQMCLSWSDLDLTVWLCLCCTELYDNIVVLMLQGVRRDTIAVLMFH